MARPLRVEYGGTVYHITSRGNAHEAIFVDNVDRAHFLEILGDVVARYGWICHAYCLMTNHYHLLIETPGEQVAEWEQELNALVYALYKLTDDEIRIIEEATK